MTLIQTINEIITHLTLQDSGDIFYRFINGIQLNKDITYEGNTYHWIDEIRYNPQTRKLNYLCTSKDSEIIGLVPVNTQSPILLQKVYNQIINEQNNK